MRNTTAVFTAALGLAMASPVAAQDSGSDPEVSVTLTGATEYVWRGVTQSDGDPAVFAAVNVSYEGFYIGAGTENVDFPGIDQEYDVWGGYVFSLAPSTTLDVGFVRYGYVDSPVDIDTIDLKAAVNTSVGKTGLGVRALWTPDYFGTDDDAFYLEGAVTQPLTEKLSVRGTVGQQWISAGGDYLNWSLGASYAVAPGASLSVAYHDTDATALGDAADGRVVGSFSVTF